MESNNLEFLNLLGGTSVDIPMNQQLQKYLFYFNITYNIFLSMVC